MPLRDTPLPSTGLVVKVSQLIRLLTLHSDYNRFSITLQSYGEILE